MIEQNPMFGEGQWIIDSDGRVTPTGPIWPTRCSSGRSNAPYGPGS